MKKENHYGIGYIYPRGSKGIYQVSFREGGRAVRISSQSSNIEVAKQMLREWAAGRNVLNRFKSPVVLPNGHYFVRPRITRAQKAAVWEKSDGFCRYCEKLTNPFVDFSVDHVIPLARGGPHSLDNMDCACKPCNLSKNVKPAQRYRYEAEA